MTMELIPFIKTDSNGKKQVTGYGAIGGAGEEIDPAEFERLKKADMLARGMPVTPDPPPALVKPIASTTFNKSPYTEKKLIDPYKTKELGILTKAELSIDNIKSSLGELVPDELVDSLQSSPDVLKELLAKGMSFNSYMKNLASKLPAMVSLPNLLREVGFDGVTSNLESFMSSIKTYGMDTLNLPSTFVRDGFAFMTEMKANLNVDRYTSEFSHMGDFSNVFGTLNKSFDFNSIIGNTGVKLAQVNALAVLPASTTSVLNVNNVPTASQFIPLMNSIKSNELAVLPVVIQNLGSKLSTDLAITINSMGTTSFTNANTTVNSLDNKDTVKAIANSIALAGSDNTDKLIQLTQSNPSETKLITDGIQIYGDTTIKTLNQIITNIGKPSVDTIVTVLDNLSLLDTLKVLNEIKNTSVDAYIATHGVGIYGNLIDAINTYDINKVINITSATNIIGKTNITNVLTVIDTLDNVNITTILDINKTPLSATLVLVVTKLLADTPTNIEIAKTKINIIGAKLASDILDANSLLTPTELNVFISLIPKIDIGILVDNIGTLNNLSTDNILAISKHLSNSEPYSFLYNGGIKGQFLEYAVKKSMDICAKAGNYKMVLNLLNSYSGNISKKYRSYLVSTILTNYKQTVDDIILGNELAAKYLAEALYKVLPSWDIDKRNGDQIKLHTGLISASNDALNLLLQYPRTAVDSILQINNKYRIA